MFAFSTINILSNFENIHTVTCKILASFFLKNIASNFDKIHTMMRKFFINTWGIGGWLSMFVFLLTNTVK